jgi:hypothetical protein
MKNQPRVIEKHSAGLGQRNAARLTLKQLYTNLRFEIANLPTQRGLRRVQSPLSGVAGLRPERLGQRASGTGLPPARRAAFGWESSKW